MDHLSNAKNSAIAAISTTAKSSHFLNLNFSPAFLFSDSHCDVIGLPFTPAVVMALLYTLGHLHDEEAAQ